MEITITITNTALPVEKRDGSSVTVDLARVPAEMFAGFALDGIAEYIRDASSTALVDAFALAHNGEIGDVETRKEWAESNTGAIAAQSAVLMTDAMERLYAGERRVSRSGSSPVDPLDKYRVKVVRNLVKAANDGAFDAKTRKALVALGEAYSAIESTDQKARRQVFLDFAADHAESIDKLAKEMKAAESVADITL